MQLFYDFTPADLAIAQGESSKIRSEMMVCVVGMFGVSAIVSAVCEVVPLFLGRSTFLGEALVMATIFLLMAVIFLSFAAWGWRYEQQKWQLMRSLNGPVLLSTSQAGLTLENAGTSAFYAPNTMRHLKEGEHMWFLSLRSGESIMIPVRVFASPDARTQFRAELMYLGVTPPPPRYEGGGMGS